MRFKNPNTSRITKNKISALFDRIVRRSAEHARGSIFDVLSQLFIEFKKFFTKAKSPRFDFTPIKKGDVLVAETYNETLMDAIEDLSVCTDETNAIKPIVISSYNASRQMAKELENRSETALSKITDIRLFEGQLGQEIIVVGDDFLTTNRIDNFFSLNAPSADIKTTEGLVTLNRIESINLVDESTNVTCEPTMPGDINISDSSTSDTGAVIESNVGRYYEGNFYNFIGSARPEGGNWHLVESFNDITEDNLNYNNTVTGDQPPDTFDQDPLGDYIPGTAIRAQDVTIVDKGATEAERNNIRRRMFDENTATFWEAEYVQELEQEGSSILGMGSSGAGTEENEELTLDELAEVAIAQDTKDFEVQVTIDFGREKEVSWLSLDPINFGQTAWLEITDIATQSSEEEGFATIPNLFNNRFANTLTNEANEELQADVAASILAPDRYSFKGKGVFNFPTVSAQYIRVKIRQKVPVPNLYQRLFVQLVRSIDTTISIKKKPGSVARLFGKRTKRRKQYVQTRMSRLVKLTYLQTLQTYNNNAPLGQFVEETDPTEKSSQTKNRGGLRGWLFGKTITNTNEKDSGWSIARDWLQVQYDKMRYAIGIRELSVFKYRFSPTSEFVSKKFTSPKEIIKAQLEVIEEIPSEFNPAQRYIEYYLSFDDENWHRVNPTGSPTLYLEDGQIAPEILTINFDIAGAGPNQSVRNITTDSPATSVRVKVIMKNDPSVGNPDSYTPVLKKYRVKLFPRTSLSRD